MKDAYRIHVQYNFITKYLFFNFDSLDSLASGTTTVITFSTLRLGRKLKKILTTLKTFTGSDSLGDYLRGRTRKYQRPVCRSQYKWEGLISKI